MRGESKGIGNRRHGVAGAAGKAIDVGEGMYRPSEERTGKVNELLSAG